MATSNTSRSFPPRYSGGNSYPSRGSFGPPSLISGGDSRRSREQEMIERMRQREEEHRRREEQLRLDREKERIKFEREKLDRERMELQHQRQQIRMQMVYERSAVMNAQSMMGVKRAYEGLDPYMPTEQKRANYGSSSTMLPTSSGAGARSGRRTPPRSSYSGRSTSYRGANSSTGRADSRRANGRSDPPVRQSRRDSRSRYDSPPQRRTTTNTSSAGGRNSSWDRSSGRRDNGGYTVSAVAPMALTGTWPVNVPASTVQTAQWRSMPGSSSSAIYGGATSNALTMFAPLSGSNATQNSAYFNSNASSNSGTERFDAYKYPSRRY